MEFPGRSSGEFRRFFCFFGNPELTQKFQSVSSPYLGRLTVHFRNSNACTRRSDSFWTWPDKSRASIFLFWGQSGGFLHMGFFWGFFTFARLATKLIDISKVWLLGCRQCASGHVPSEWRFSASIFRVFFRVVEKNPRKTLEILFLLLKPIFRPLSGAFSKLQRLHTVHWLILNVWRQSPGSKKNFWGSFLGFF